MKWLDDAHNHLQDARFEHPGSMVQKSVERGVRWMMVNGTEPKDWERVAALTKHYPEVCLPSFGIHPWKAHLAEGNWKESLIMLLESFPQAGVGEIGLDRWVDQPQLQVQWPVFEEQWDLADRMKRSLTIHCLKAWDDLYAWLKLRQPPSRGFLLHSFSGPETMIEGLVRKGAWFSFSGWFLHPSRSRAREAFRKIPIERLLIETDAPDMAPPSPWNAMTETLPKSWVRGKWVPTHHPGDLVEVGRALAKFLEYSEEEFLAHMRSNFEAFFLGQKNTSHA